MNRSAGFACVTDYQSKVTSYTYTDAGQLSTITAPGSKTWDYDYLDGFVTKYSHPNGMTTNYEYDNRSRLTKIEHKDGSTVKLGFTYTLDDNGNVTDVEHDGGETWEYFYDGRNRLTKAERDNSSATLQHRYTYTYDDADNLLTKAIYNGTTTTNTIYKYNTANELTKHGNDDLEYDAWGRLTTKFVPLIYTATYSYRYGDKLYEVDSSYPGEGDVTYEYGDDGQRKSRTEGSTTTNYYYDGWNVINEKTGSMWTTYTFDTRQPVGNILSQVDGDPATGAYEYFAHDKLGSTRALYNQSKTEVAGYEYSPYGEDYGTPSGSSSTDYRFTGKGWDTTSDLYHFPFRYYATEMARWITRDPLGMIDGPNTYLYTRANPSSHYDLDGRLTDCAKCLARLAALTILALTVCGVLLALCVASRDPLLCFVAAVVCAWFLASVAIEATRCAEICAEGYKPPMTPPYPMPGTKPDECYLPIPYP